MISTPVLIIGDTSLPRWANCRPGVRLLVVVGLDSRILILVSLHQLIADRQRRYLAVLQANLRNREQQFPGRLLDIVR